MQKDRRQHSNSGIDWHDGAAMARIHDALMPVIAEIGARNATVLFAYLFQAACAAEEREGGARVARRRGLDFDVMQHVQRRARR